MSNITIISAGAGTGKTHRLAELLLEEVEAGRVRPEAVLATTFTNKAAAELQERVRARLLAAGKAEAAQRITAARMGTVNSVCGRLVTEFAFELGVSPRVRVLDEAGARAALARSLSDAMTADDAREIAELGSRLVEFEGDNALEAIRRVVEFARTNGIVPELMSDCARRSAESFRDLLGPSRSSAKELDDALATSIDVFLAAVGENGDVTKDTQAAVKRAELARAQLRGEVSIAWSEWAALSVLRTGAISRLAAEGLRAAAARHHGHPRLGEDVERTIRIVFDVAARALAAYANSKRVQGVIDFTDQEVHTLDLLGRESVRDALRDKLDLVLVDEFQDTSPIQLAIFLRMAELARKCVWVGDQKQAIYGFRGTDPALMDLAVATILDGTEPETLGMSWRSRPELVRLTSDLFAPAFEMHGLPAARTRLVPRLEEEPTGLGPIVERWMLASKNKDADAAATAAAVSALLADGTTLVRDRASGETRTVRPDDVAVLCRTNEDRDKVAAQIEALGISVEIPRAGLLGTPEAQAFLAGLRLWIDDGDTLALAQLARLVEFPADGAAWLRTLLEKPGRESFADVQVIRRIRDARVRLSDVGAVAAFDAVLDAMDLWEACLAWGDSSRRLANLDALRAHAWNYAQACANDGMGCTPAGLVAHFESLASDAEDAQALLGGDAVVVSSWHGSKGLEWPITVLCNLASSRAASALGVSVSTERKALDVRAPLAGRWIRFWPNPYRAQSKNTAFHAALDGHPQTVAAREQEARERLRLLYVGWTRARDRVALAEREGKLTGGILSDLVDGNGTGLICEPGATTTWGGRRVEVLVRTVAAAAPQPRIPEAGAGYIASGAKEHAPAFSSPSQAAPERVRAEMVAIGRRLAVGGKPDMSDLGSALHGFFAADRAGLALGARRAIAEGLLERWNVHSALSPDDVVAASDSLQAWAEAKWPGAIWRREWPISQRLTNGTVVRGRIDLLLETSGRLVVIDHKTYPGRLGEAVERARSHAGQLMAYAAAASAASGMTTADVFVHLATLGQVVRLVAQDVLSSAGR